MKIRPLKRIPVSADEKGMRTRVLSPGETYEAVEPWEADLFTRLVEAKMAEEADKVVEPPENKMIETKTRSAKNGS